MSSNTYNGAYIMNYFIFGGIFMSRLIFRLGGLYLWCLYSRGLGLYSASYIFLAGHIFLEVNLYSSGLIFFLGGLIFGWRLI